MMFAYKLFIITTILVMIIWALFSINNLYVTIRKIGIFDKKEVLGQCGIQSYNILVLEAKLHFTNILLAIVVIGMIAAHYPS